MPQSGAYSLSECIFKHALGAIAIWMTRWECNFWATRATPPFSSLRNFYGDNMYINTAEEIAGIPISWPGSNLDIGSSGDKVEQLQEQLNAIRQGYPALPAVTVDGIYGEGTQRAVRDFQRIFSLPVTGIVDYPPGTKYRRSTWASQESRNLYNHHQKIRKGRVQILCTQPCRILFYSLLISLNRTNTMSSIKRTNPAKCIIPSTFRFTSLPRMASMMRNTRRPPSSAGMGSRFITPRLADRRMTQ